MNRNPLATTFGVSGSLVFHLGVFLYGYLYLTTPDLDFEIEFPSEIEFGLTDEAVVAVGGPTASAPVAAVAPTQTEPEGDEEVVVVDAGAPLADNEADTGPAEVAVADTGPPGTEETEGAGGDDEEGEMRLPPGAQIALRLDMARIRTSTLSSDVRRLLVAIPDWRAVLEGSAIDPLDDLDRVLIASPNLERSRMVLAGRYEAARVDVDAVVARMAAARGVAAPWRVEGGVPVANWANLDATERVVAKVGPRHFTITRPEDLPRILAVARVRAEEEADEAAEENDAPPPSGADALLSMEEGEALSVEVEGARQFVRGMTRGVPTRLRLSVEERADGVVRVRAWGDFDTEADADAAVVYWTALKEQAARNAFVRMMGFGPPLTQAELVADGTEVRAESSLGPRQIRTILDFLRGELEARERRTRARDPTPAPNEPPAGEAATEPSEMR